MNSKVLRFGAVGLTATTLDFAAYTLFSLVLPTWIAKGTGFAFGTACGFLLNRTWAFRYKGPATEVLGKYILLYLATLILNVVVNQLVLFGFGTNTTAKLTAFIAATLVSAIVNYLVIDNFIFKSKDR